MNEATYIVDLHNKLTGERVYVGYSDSTQATIVEWKGELR
jgi:hypothetical protein